MISEISGTEPEKIQQILIRLSEEGLTYHLQPTETPPESTIISLYNPTTKQILKVPQSYQTLLGQIAIFEWTTYLLKGKEVQCGSLGGIPLIKLDVAFDVAVLMKVLPKFNGPRNRLRQPLEQVIYWAKNPGEILSQDLTDQLKNSEQCRKLLKQLPDGFVYPETARKAIRMLIRLHETGFASFA